MKFCKDCRYHINTMHNPNAPEVWYNHLCKASPLPETVDPVTGKKGYGTQNSLGMSIVQDNPFEYCRDVNMDGNCAKFGTEIKFFVAEEGNG